MVREIFENEAIKWDALIGYFVVRDNKLILIPRKDWMKINTGEKYCGIMQSPSTPPDFGLYLKERKDLVEVEGYYYPLNDEDILDIYNYHYINPIDIKSFILQDKKFYNWYDKVYE